MTFLHKLAKRLAIAPVAVLPLGLIVACGDGSQQAYLGPDPNKPSASSYIGLSISPHDPQIVMGDSVRLSAQGWLSNGLSQPVGVTWSASSGSVDASGWYRPVTTGAFRVRAQVSGTSLSDSILVTVSSPAGIARLDVTPGVASLSAGSRQQFTAVALMGNGTQVLPTVSWSATGGSISGTGLFTAGTEGSYSVTASLLGGSVIGRATGVVEPAELLQLSISPAAVQLESSTGRQFTAQALWTDGSAALPELEWSATGGTISSTGAYLAGSTPGTYRVVVRSAQHERADTSIVTILPRIIGLRLAPLTAMLALEATQVVTAYAQRSDGTESPTAVQWSAQGGSISLGGVYTAGTIPGTYQVTGTLPLVSGEVLTAQAEMQVATDADEPAGGVQLQVLPDTTMYVGGSNRFRVAVVGGGAVPSVTWSATGGSIDQTGLYIAGPNTGSYQVVAKKKGGNSRPDTATVTLVPAPILTVSGFTLTPQSDIIAQGQSRQFSATLNWSDGLTHPASISWIASGGTITSNGLYTAGTVAGTFFVIATCSCGVADTSSVSIPVAASAPITLSRVILNPATVSLAPGGTQQFSVSGVWSDGATSPPPVYYSAEGGSISQAGLYLAGNVAGTYKVIATHTQSPVADTSFVTVVVPTVAPELTQLVLNPSSVIVQQGSTQAFTVAASWSDGSSTVPPVTFEATGGTVSSSGVYTAGTTAGIFRVIVRNTGGTKADTSVVTIPTAVTLTSFLLNPGSVSLTAGSTQQFVVTASWSDGSTSSPAVSWNVTGGTMSSSGLYTAGSTSGTFRVIATQTGGTRADTTAVSINATVPPPTSTVAELPRVYLNTSYAAPSGSIINVPAGGSLQTALNNAQPGDQIVLAAGATYTGNFSLPAKSGCLTDGWIVVRGSIVPTEGVRVTPAVAASFPKLVTPNTAHALLAGANSCGWRIIGLELTLTPQGGGVDYNYGLARIGEGESTLSAQPHDIILDRMYIHGTPTTSVQHAVIMNGARTSLIDSYVSEVHWPGTETHAIAGWAGAGPFKIVNNFLEAASVNLMFGGADPVIVGLHPSDIEIRRNYFYKPLAWRGVGYSAKNLLEIKHAQRVLIEGNVFQNSWTEAQDGMALNFQSSAATGNLWPQTADITVRYNRFTNVNVCAVILATDYFHNGIPLARLNYEHNFCDLSTAGAVYRGFLIGGAVSDVRIARNTIKMSSVQDGGPLYIEFTGAQNFSFVDNVISPSGIYSPAFMSGGYMGTDALNRFAGSTWVYTGNVVGAQNSYVSSSVLPAGNTWPSSVTINSDGSVAGYPGKGADMTGLLAAIAGAVP